MTIASEITRIKTNIENTYTALEEKGATMPEVQNSANLADTVATVNSGGGSGVVRGVWTVPELYLQLDNEVENDLKLTELKTNKNPYILNYGIIFDRRLKKVTIKFAQLTSAGSGVPYAIRTSDGAYYENTEDTFGYSVTHTFTSTENDNWIIFYTRDVSTPQTLNIMDYNIFSYAEYRYIKYIVFNSYAYPYIGSSLLESFNILGNNKIKLSGNSIPDFTLDSYTPLKYLPDISNFENDFSTCTSFGSYTNKKVLPNGANLSGITSDITFGGATNNAVDITDLYVTLPSVNVTFAGGSSSVLSYDKVVLSYDNWEYLAEHAPTVSGKSLKMNAINYNLVGGAGSEIVTAFEAKGWTVSAT